MPVKEFLKYYLKYHFRIMTREEKKNEIQQFGKV